MTIDINGESRQVPNPSSISDVVALLDLKPLNVAIEVNCELVPREQHSQFQLSAGDKVEIVTLVGGG